MNVLVIPEDFRKDQYILKPVIEAMLKAVGKPRAKVIVCKDPLLGSVEQALKWERIRDIIRRYQGMTDLFLLCVDRDGLAGRRFQLDEIEKQAKEHSKEDTVGCLFFAENAWQEIRRERDPKERYFVPFAKRHGVFEGPGEGRKALATEAASHYPRIRSRCPEDIAALEDRIRSAFTEP